MPSVFQGRRPTTSAEALQLEEDAPGLASVSDSGQGIWPGSAVSGRAAYCAT